MTKPQASPKPVKRERSVSVDSVPLLNDKKLTIDNKSKDILERRNRILDLQFQNESMLLYDSSASLDEVSDEETERDYPQVGELPDQIHHSGKGSLWTYFLAEFEGDETKESFLYKNERVVSHLSRFNVSRETF
jgi:hypothetical protein